MTVLDLERIRAYCEPLAIGVAADRFPPGLFFDRCADCRVYVSEIDASADVGFDMAATMVEPDRAAFPGALVSTFY